MNIEKERQAIDWLRKFDGYAYSDKPYYLCYSGGKDSDVILALAKMAGVKYEAVHNLTTVDAPETIYHVKAQPDVRIDKPEKTMWQLIVEKRMPPTQICRYCCSELKERGGRMRAKITGVRWAESTNRKKNRALVNIEGGNKRLVKMIEEAGLDIEYEINTKGGMVMNCDNDDSCEFVHRCLRTNSVMINPIIDWTDDDVWEFLCHYGIEVNPLYEAKEINGKYCPFGKNRVGCISCPFGGSKSMKAELIRYPKYRDNYLRAFDRMQKKRKEDGLPPFGFDSYGEMSAAQIMMWWVRDDPRQLSLFGLPEYLRGACL